MTHRILIDIYKDLKQYDNIIEVSKYKYIHTRKIGNIFKHADITLKGNRVHFESEAFRCHLDYEYIFKKYGLKDYFNYDDSYNRIKFKIHIDKAKLLLKELYHENYKPAKF